MHYPALDNATTHNELDTIVNAWLVNRSQVEQAAEETYEETAERLDSDFMRAAAQRWHAIDAG